MKISKTKFLIITIILILSSVFLVIRYLSINFWPILMLYSKTEVEHLTIEIMNQAIATQIVDSLDVDDLYEVQKDNNGDIELIDFNSKRINEVLIKINLIIQECLRALELGEVEKLEEMGILFNDSFLMKIKNGVVGEIPIGNVTNNAILSNVGPKIPIRINFLGNVTSNVFSEVKDYGINNALLETSVRVNLKVKIILPLLIENVDIQTDIPLSIKIIQGQVPLYYQWGFGNTSGLITSTPEK